MNSTKEQTVIDAILFDIDGTLITTGGAGAAAWRMAFEDLHGIPADIGMFSDAGMTDPEVGRRTFVAVLDREPTPRELATLLARRLAHLPGAVYESPRYRVLPGVDELLPKLADDGYLLGLTTGGTDSAAHIKLARANLARWFTFGGYGSDSTDRTELTRCAIRRAGMLVGMELDPANVLVVGDTPKDVDAARGAGAISVAVASGHYSAGQLREAGADHVLDSLEEPLPLVGEPVVPPRAPSFASGLRPATQESRDFARDGCGEPSSPPPKRTSKLVSASRLDAPERS